MQMPTLDKFPRKVLAKVDIQTAFMVSRLVIAAERLQVFRLLNGREMTASAIARALKIHEYYLKPFLNSLVSVGLLRTFKDTYSNTGFTKHYFIDERAIYWTRQYSKECVNSYKALTLLEKSLASGKDYTTLKHLKVPSYIEAMTRNPGEAEDFTQMLFYRHQDVAKALARFLDLSKRHSLLDVAGGSGVMSIALAKKNPHLRVSILDIAAVCKIATGNIRRARLSGRVSTLPGDIREPLPEGFDAIMFCDIGVVSKQLLMNAYRSLPPYGLVVLVDRYMCKEGTNPLERLAHHFVGSSFGLETWVDMVERLKSCGFEAVRARNVYRDVWFITGVKPASPNRRGRV